MCIPVCDDPRTYWVNRYHIVLYSPESFKTIRLTRLKKTPGEVLLSTHKLQCEYVIHYVMARPRLCGGFV